MNRWRQWTGSRRLGFGLVALLILGCAMLQLWLLGARWINPDEGAHLMDARLAMEGLVPGVDYNARQPLYVYAYVPFLRLLGPTCMAGRVMPLAATWLAAVVLVVIGRRLWGVREGLYAGLLYLAAPTVLISASLVKTEPLAILLVCVGMWGLVAHLHGGRWWPLIVAGAALGAGYYVRESTLAGLFAVSVIVLAHARQGMVLCVKRLVALYAGWASVCGVVIAWYARYLPLSTVLSSAQCPLHAVALPLATMRSWWTPSGAGPAVAAGTGGSAAVIEAVIRQSAQAWPQTMRNLGEAVALNLPFLIGMVAALGFAWGIARSREERPGRSSRADGLGLVVAFAWVGSTALLYAYHVFHRGFFQFYFREFIPPMALALGYVLVRLLERQGWEQYWLWLLPASAGVLLSVFAFQRGLGGGGVSLSLLVLIGVGWAVFHDRLRTSRRRVAYLASGAAFLAVCVLVRGSGSLGVLREVPGAWFLAAAAIGVVAWVWIATRSLPIGRLFPFACFAALGAASVITVSVAARVLSPAYDCVWSPRTAAQVIEAVRTHSRVGDTVLSGAVLWEFEAGRRPFLNITHPLGFRYGMSSEQAARLRRGFEEEPPEIVVLDGYTEKSYLPWLEGLVGRIESSYRLVEEVRGSKYPVRIYVRQRGGPSGPLAASVAQ